MVCLRFIVALVCLGACRRCVTPSRSSFRTHRSRRSAAWQMAPASGPFSANPHPRPILMADLTSFRVGLRTGWTSPVRAKAPATDDADPVSRLQCSSRRQRQCHPARAPTAAAHSWLHAQLPLGFRRSQAASAGMEYNFIVATHQATDYSTFIFLGLTSHHGRRA